MCSPIFARLSLVVMVLCGRKQVMDTLALNSFTRYGWFVSNSKNTRRILPLVPENRSGGRRASTLSCRLSYPSKAVAADVAILASVWSCSR